DVQAERNIGTGIVHVVALDALVHDAKAAANNGLAPAVEVVGKAEARTEGSPVVIHQAFGHAVLAGNPDAIQVERNTRKDRVRTRSQARTCSAGAACCCAVCRPANSITGSLPVHRAAHARYAT